jgi:hypothetical protein
VEEVEGARSISIFLLYIRRWLVLIDSLHLSLSRSFTSIIGGKQICRGFHLSATDTRTSQPQPYPYLPSSLSFSFHFALHLPCLTPSSSLLVPLQVRLSPAARRPASLALAWNRWPSLENLVSLDFCSAKQRNYVRNYLLSNGLAGNIRGYGPLIGVES